MNTLVLGILRLGGIPRQQLILFCCRHHRQRIDGFIWVSHNLCQQRLEVSHHTLNGVCFKQVRIVLKDAA